MSNNVIAKTLTLTGILGSLATSGVAGYKVLAAREVGAMEVPAVSGPSPSPIIVNQGSPATLTGNANPLPSMSPDPSPEISPFPTASTDSFPIASSGNDLFRDSDDDDDKIELKEDEEEVQHEVEYEAEAKDTD